VQRAKSARIEIHLPSISPEFRAAVTSGKNSKLATKAMKSSSEVR